MYVGDLWWCMRPESSERSLGTSVTIRTTRAGSHSGSVGGPQLASDHCKWLNVITDHYAVLSEQYTYCGDASAAAAWLLGTANRADLHPPLATTRAVSAFQSLLEDIVGPYGAGLTHCGAL